MQKNRKLKARILSLAMSVMMVATTIPAPVFAAREGGTLPDAEASGVIVSFDKLEDRFEPSTGKEASEHIYGLAVELDTPFEDLKLPTELTAMVSRTSVEEAPPEEPKEPETTEAETTEAETTEAETTEAEETEAETTESETTEAETTEAETTESETTEAETTEAETTEAETTEAETTEAETTEAETTESETTEAEITESETTEAETTEAEDEKTASTENADDSNIISAFGKTAGDFTLVSEETIPVTWNGNKEYKSDENGKFIYTAVLPEDYILADGVKLPQIYVLVGMQARDARADAITVTINGTSSEGATLQEAVGKPSGGATAVTSLKITAGEVTSDDWNYLKSLSAMTIFEIDGAVTVAAMPTQKSGSLFPKSIVTVTVPQAITICERAFYRCQKLTTVSFPAATSIGKSGFTQCTVLTTATIPAATSIGDDAFSVCKALTTADFPAATSIGKNAFNGCGALTSTSLPVAKTIGEQAFESCTALTSASLPAVETIESRAFASCDKLATLKLGATVPTVGSEALAGDYGIRALSYVDANGNELTGDALAAAISAYKEKADADDASKWNGWTIEPAITVASITIGTQPTSPAAITYGSITGSLTVAGTASNSNTVSYQWYQNTTNSATGGTAVTGATSASFTIPTTLDAGTHYYYCILKATDCADKASNVATVTVNKATATDTMKTVAATVSKNGATGATATLPTKPAAATYGTITYGGAFTCSNASVNGDTLTYTAPASTAGDTGTITIPVTTSTNYNDYDIVVTITSTDKKAATITAAVADKTYNGVAVTQPTPTAVEKDTTTPVTLTYTYKWQKSNGSGGYTDISGNTAPKDAGSYKLVIEGSSDTHAGTKDIEFTISKATVTITADNKSAYVGDAKPALTYTATDLASGDTLATVPTLTYESEPDMSKAGSVKIKASGAVVPNTDNYESAITYVDGTLTISNKSSGGGGGGGSSSSQAIYTSVPPKYTGGTKIIGNVRVPDYTVEGAWKKNENGTWNFSGNGGQVYANSWAPVFNPYADVTKGQSAFDWFKFDANGIMITGWHIDADGNTYYLNPTSDNTLGAMKTGWVLIDGKHYYFNETSDGTRGKLFKNTTTPDGYLVDENGVSAGK